MAIWLVANQHHSTEGHRCALPAAAAKSLNGLCVLLAGASSRIVCSTCKGFKAYRPFHDEDGHAVTAPALVVRNLNLLWQDHGSACLPRGPVAKMGRTPQPKDYQASPVVVAGHLAELVAGRHSHIASSADSPPWPGILLVAKKLFLFEHSLELLSGEQMAVLLWTWCLQLRRRGSTEMVQ